MGQWISLGGSKQYVWNVETQKQHSNAKINQTQTIVNVLNVLTICQSDYFAHRNDLGFLRTATKSRITIF